MCKELTRELDGIDLGDKRLNARSRLLMERLGANPAASINASCIGWSETKAAYEFFDNERVEPQKVLLQHRKATEVRIRDEDVVLIVQDTTELNYSQHPTEDSGVLDKDYRFGLYDHSHIAFTPVRLCLGVVGVEFFSRTPESLGKSRERRNDPIETKESFRWLKGYRLACELAVTCPDTQIVSVADCECDIYDIFVEAEQQETPADFVIRAKQDRRLPELNPAGGPEVFFRVFKTGCRVEDIRLETNRRLMNSLMFYKVIAWRIMYVTFLGREYPNMACDEIFADVEWKPVWKIVSDDPIPATAPPLSVFIPMLAELGGYNNRSTDHPPGPQAIWTGMRRMIDFSIAWTAFGPKDET